MRDATRSLVAAIRAFTPADERPFADALDDWICTVLCYDQSFPWAYGWSDGLLFERCDVDVDGFVAAGVIFEIESQQRVRFDVAAQIIDDEHVAHALRVELADGSLFLDGAPIAHHE